MTGMRIGPVAQRSAPTDRVRCNAATTSCLTDSLPVQVLNRSRSHHPSQDTTDLPMLPGPTPTYPLRAISLGTP